MGNHTSGRCRRLLLPVMLLCLFLTGCGRGNPLPAGMEEDAVITAGVEVVKAIGDRDYQTVLDRFRSDVRETLTIEKLEDLVSSNTVGCGYYVQVEDSMATGQESDGESYGVAVLYAKYSKGSVLYRVAFDPDMELIGLSVDKQ